MCTVSSILKAELSHLHWFLFQLFLQLVLQLIYLSMGNRKGNKKEIKGKG